MTRKLTVKGWLTLFGAGFVMLMILSWVGGQCRQWSKPKPPIVVPAAVDPGTATPGPVADAPTQPKCVEAEVPVLTRDEVAALAKKYGILPSTRPPTGLNTPNPTPAPVLGDKPAESLKTPQPEPDLLGNVEVLSERTFTHEASGVSADVICFTEGFGSRVQQKAVWHPWTKPTVPKPEGFFGNEGKWEGVIGGGFAADTDNAGPSLLLGFGFRGVRLGHGTLGIDALAMPFLADSKLKGQGGIYATLHIK